MNRDIQEIIASQGTMLKKLGKKQSKTFPLHILDALEKSKLDALNWAKNQHNVELLELNYKNVLANPINHSMQIADFLGKKMQIEKMIQTIDPSLYHEKLNPSLTKTL